MVIIDVMKNEKNAETGEEGEEGEKIPFVEGT